MTAPAKRKAHVISSFDDAGTGESFTADDTPMIEAGTFANYEAAGLVRAAVAEPKPKSTPKPAAPARRKPTTRRSSAGTSAPTHASTPTPIEPATAEEIAPSE